MIADRYHICMGQLLIRNLDDRTIERYRSLARLSGRSLEGEVRKLLNRGVELEAEGKRELSRKLRNLTRNPAGSEEGWSLIREDRDAR